VLVVDALISLVDAACGSGGRQGRIQQEEFVVLHLLPVARRCPGAFCQGVQLLLVLLLLQCRFQDGPFILHGDVAQEMQRRKLPIRIPPE